MARTEQIKYKLEVDGVENVEKDLNGVGSAAESLRKQLREATLELQRLSSAEVIDDKAIENAAQRVGELRDRISEANERASVFAGNTFENLQASISGVQEGIMTLDFDKVSTMLGAVQTNAMAAFEGLNNASSKVLGGIVDGFKGAALSAGGLFKSFATNPFGTLAGGVSKFGGALKNLGGTIVSVGKAILTNPIFLLAAVITAVVVAVIKLMDSLGLLQPILDGIKAAIDFVVNSFKALTDWLGLTAHAAEESADRQIAAAERTKKQSAEISSNYIQALQNEIKIKKSLGEDTTAIEYELIVAQRDRVADQIAENRKDIANRQHKLKVSKGLSDEEIKAINDEIKALRQSTLDKRREYSSLNADAIAFRNDAKREREKDSEDAKKKAEQDRKDAADNYKKLINDRLKALETTLKVDIARTKEGSVERLEAEKKYIDEIEKFQSQNRTTLEISENQMTLIKLENVEKRKKLESDYTKSIEARDKAIIDSANKTALLEAEIRVLAAADENIRLEERKKQIQLEGQIKLDNTELTAEETKKIELETANAIAEIDNQITQNKKTQEEKRIENIRKGRGIVVSSMLEGQQKDLEMEQLAYEDSLSALKSALDEKLITEEQYNTAVENAKLTHEEKVAEIDKKYKDQESARRKRVADAALQVAGDSLSAISSLTEAFAGKSEKEQRKAFQIQKGVQIAQATIDTYKAAVGAYSSMSSIPVVGPALGAVAAAAAVAAGIANIVKIKNTKFEGGSTPSGGGGGVPSITSPSGGAAPTPPSLNTFGTGMSSEEKMTQEIGVRQMMVKAVVVESDITNTQNTIKKYNQSAEIG